MAIWNMYGCIAKPVGVGSTSKHISGSRHRCVLVSQHHGLGNLDNGSARLASNKNHVAADPRSENSLAAISHGISMALDVFVKIYYVEIIEANFCC
jgi:hypothetical protein